MKTRRTQRSRPHHGNCTPPPGADEKSPTIGSGEEDTAGAGERYSTTGADARVSAGASEKNSAIDAGEGNTKGAGEQYSITGADA